MPTRCASWDWSSSATRSSKPPPAAAARSAGAPDALAALGRSAAPGQRPRHGHYEASERETARRRGERGERHSRRRFLGRAASLASLAGAGAVLVSCEQPAAARPDALLKPPITYVA